MTGVHVEVPSHMAYKGGTSSSRSPDFFPARTVAFVSWLWIVFGLIINQGSREEKNSYKVGLLFGSTYVYKQGSITYIFYLQATF